MKSKKGIEQLLLLKDEYRINLEHGNKNGARECLNEIARIYNKISGKKFWDQFSEEEKEKIKNSLDEKGLLELDYDLTERE